MTARTVKGLAAYWDVTQKIVLNHIKSGELRAFNVSRRKGRPTWRIPEDAVTAFEQARAVQQPTPRKRRTKDPSITEYF